MYRIRFHGRGGQGIKTASRILGTAFFLEGYEVQDAPVYGAERRGAPINAYVRAQHRAIHERGVIARPDLIVAVDPSLLPLSGVGVAAGADAETVLLLNAAELPRQNGAGGDFPGRVVLLPPLSEQAAQGPLPLMAVAAAGAAGRLVGAISAEALREAIAQELQGLDNDVLAQNLELALSAFKRLEAEAGMVSERPEPELSGLEKPRWIELNLEPARRAAVLIENPANSNRVPTGLWRTERPLIDPERCKGCWWVCGTFCPDGVIHAREGQAPEIDLDHCKGCLICLAMCPSHAISALPEAQAATEQTQPAGGSS